MQAKTSPTFRELCHQGRLFEIIEWIEGGHPIEVPRSRRYVPTPVEIAVTRGFHSLVEVLLKHGFPPDPDSLYEVTHQRRTDMLRLLFDFGAKADSIDFGTVLETGNREIIEMFIDRGVDTVTEYPIAAALVRAPKLFCGVYKTYINRFPEWEFQANVALRRAAEDSKLRAACLLMWLGADPRVRVPYCWGEEDNEFNLKTAIEVAVLVGNLDVLKALKPSAEADDLNEHLACACNLGNLPVIDHLLSLGADLNSVVTDRGSIAGFLVRSFSRSIEWAHESHFGSHKREAEECLKRCIELGAKWTNIDPYDFRCLRKAFGCMNSYDVLSWLRLFRDAGFCSLEDLVTLMKTKRMREHMTPQMSSLAAILPSFERWIPGRSGKRPTRR